MVLVLWTAHEDQLPKVHVPHSSHTEGPTLGSYFWPSSVLGTACTETQRLGPLRLHCYCKVKIQDLGLSWTPAKRQLAK